MKVKDNKNAFIGGAAIVIGLIMTAVPIAALMGGFIVLLYGSFMFGQAVDFEMKKEAPKEANPEQQKGNLFSN